MFLGLFDWGSSAADCEEGIFAISNKRTTSPKTLIMYVHQIYQCNLSR